MLRLGKEAYDFLVKVRAHIAERLRLVHTDHDQRLERVEFEFVLVSRRDGGVACVIGADVCAFYALDSPHFFQHRERKLFRGAIIRSGERDDVVAVVAHRRRDGGQPHHVDDAGAQRDEGDERCEHGEGGIDRGVPRSRAHCDVGGSVTQKPPRSESRKAQEVRCGGDDPDKRHRDEQHADDVQYHIFHKELRDAEGESRESEEDGDDEGRLARHAFVAAYESVDGSRAHPHGRKGAGGYAAEDAHCKRGEIFVSGSGESRAHDELVKEGVEILYQPFAYAQPYQPADDGVERRLDDEDEGRLRRSGSSRFEFDELVHPAAYNDGEG